jgi:hypothetical protein
VKVWFEGSCKTFATRVFSSPKVVLIVHLCVYLDPRRRTSARQQGW